MGSVALLMLIVAGFLVYEVVKSIPASAASTSTTVTPSGGTAGNASLLPTSFLQKLAAHESPSALQGNFQYGAFGLQCGAGQGYASGCTPPILGGAGDVASYDLFPNWPAAVNGLSAWINKNAPSAWGYAASGDCVGFMSALQKGGYGGTAQWPSLVCSL